MKIAVIIPVTSNRCNFISFKDTDLFNILFKSFFNTYNLNHEYKFYLGIDSDDKFYQDNTVQNDIKRFINIMKNTSIEILTIDSSNKGNVCFIWNELFKKAYEDNYDYFVQIGSDIYFQDKDWVNSCIDLLKQNNDIGVVGMADMGRKKYNPNDHDEFQAHVDVGDNRNCTRFLVFFVYLDDNEKGGVEFIMYIFKIIRQNMNHLEFTYQL